MSVAGTTSHLLLTIQEMHNQVQTITPEEAAKRLEEFYVRVADIVEQNQLLLEENARLRQAVAARNTLEQQLTEARADLTRSPLFPFRASPHSPPLNVPLSYFAGSPVIVISLSSTPELLQGQS